MHIPGYFKLYELLPKDFYNKYLSYKGDNLWFLFDDRLLKCADRLRERYGKMIANTWYWGGKHQYRGWRPFDCTVGSAFSQHKFGRALDLVPDECTAEEIRKDILQSKNQDIFIDITCIETKVSWLHVDVRNWDKPNKGIFLVNP